MNSEPKDNYAQLGQDVREVAHPGLVPIDEGGERPLNDAPSIREGAVVIPDTVNIIDGQLHPALDSNSATTDTQPNTEQATHPRSLRGRFIVIGTAAIAAVATGVIFLGHMGSDDRKVEAKPNQPTTGALQPSGHQATSSIPETKPSPTDTALPTTDNAPIIINGNKFSAGNLDPTTPIAVPYVAGQPASIADVEKLVHNISVAITTGNTDDLLYSGIVPTSDFGIGLQDQIAHYKQGVMGANNPFQYTFYDKDIQFDPNDPTTVRVITEAGSALDARIGNVNFSLLTLTLGTGEVTLPNGQVENIRKIAGTVDVTPSNSTDWYNGFNG